MKQESQKRKTDEELLKGLVDNDSRIIYMFYDSYFPMTRKMVLQNSGDEASAKDLFQEALIVLYDKVSERDFSLTAQLSTYIYAICKRLWLKQLHQRKKDPIFPDYKENDEALPEIEDDLIDHEAKEYEFQRLSWAMSKLGSPCKDLLEDFYTKKHSMQQLTDTFNYTNTDNAKTQKYKCLQRLKKIFFSKIIDLNKNNIRDER